MGFRYYKRPWDEPRGDAFDAWGSSVWYFEVGEDEYPVRQLERYAHGPVLRYSSVHVEDHYGGLGDQPLDREELAPFEITKEEFDAAWSVPIICEDEPRDYNEVFRAISSADANALRALIAAGHDINAPDPRPYIGDMKSPRRGGARRRALRPRLDAADSRVQRRRVRGRQAARGSGCGYRGEEHRGLHGVRPRPGRCARAPRVHAVQAGTIAAPVLRHPQRTARALAGWLPCYVRASSALVGGSPPSRARPLEKGLHLRRGKAVCEPVDLAHGTEHRTGVRIVCAEVNRPLVELLQSALERRDDVPLDNVCEVSSQ